ncbi:uncharacterized protein LOC120317584 [Crotalus tigris]|uniref:uncharacterized protein LOC120317584 n=1 Tax=Crotalus tigris TaxID=88082 RepID=UPI00192FAD83|nr:uncharacterized protein LOC120317584 [Crotalus tigris]
MGYLSTYIPIKVEISKAGLSNNYWTYWAFKSHALPPITHKETHSLRTSIIPFLNMLGMLTAEQKQLWTQHISTAVHACNSMKNDATGYSPYQLMFGREARLPVDITFGISMDETSIRLHRNYVDRLRRNLKMAYEKALVAAGVREQRNKRNYDLKLRVQDLQLGNRVLLRNLGLPGKHKLAYRWGSQLYIVSEKSQGLPVYRIQPEGSSGPLKAWHRNHVLPLNEAIRVSQPAVAKASEPCSTGRRSETQAQPDPPVEEEEDSEEEEGCMGWLWSLEDIGATSPVLDTEVGLEQLRSDARVCTQSLGMGRSSQRT